MKPIELEEKTIKGISTRTKNENEQNSQTAKIAPLWMEFCNSFSQTFQSGVPIYGVYFDYESDANGEFNVLAGAESHADHKNIEVKEVKIQKGRYLVFNNEGKMPDVVIEAWTEVWSYFNDPKCEFKRAYLTDFELYKSQNEIELYIGIE